VYPVWDVVACPHGSYLVSGGSDRTARLWSTEHARPLRIYAGASTALSSSFACRQLQCVISDALYCVHLLPLDRCCTVQLQFMSLALPRVNHSDVSTLWHQPLFSTASLSAMSCSILCSAVITIKA
jgi:WD40 repeat protein